MTTTKCCEIGNSLGMLLSGAARQQLNLHKGDDMSVAVIDGALVMRPVSPRTARILACVPDLMRRHRDALQDLGVE